MDKYNPEKITFTIAVLFLATAITLTYLLAELAKHLQEVLQCITSFS